MKQKMAGASGGAAEEEATLDEAYYGVVRQLGYTWRELLDEMVPQTVYSIDQLSEEAKERKKQQEEAEKKAKAA